MLLTDNSAFHDRMLLPRREAEECLGMLKVLSGAAIIALAAVSTASAADLALKAPPAAPVKFTWTGCFIGGHVGGVVSQDRATNNLDRSIDYSPAGFVGGGQIGCDYQFAPNWVIGAEGRVA